MGGMLPERHATGLSQCCAAHTIYAVQIMRHREVSGRLCPCMTGVVQQCENCRSWAPAPEQMAWGQCRRICLCLTSWHHRICSGCHACLADFMQDRCSITVSFQN